MSRVDGSSPDDGGEQRAAHGANANDEIVMVPVSRSRLDDVYAALGRRTDGEAKRAGSR